MPIPANLWEFSITGGLSEDPGEFFAPLLWEWTLVWHSLITPDDVNGFNAEEVATEIRNRLQNAGVQPQFNPWGRNQVVRREDRSRVDGSLSAVSLGNTIMNPGAVPPSVAPQTALFVLGRTQKLGTQTRKWIPGLRRDLLGDPVPKWFADGAAQDLSAWAFQTLESFQFVTPFGQVMVDVQHVCWDEPNEVVHPITSLRYQAWPRTQRRRANDADPHWIDPL